jgi:hypothetical protein
VKVAAVILDPATFGSSKNSLMVFGALAAGDIYTYVVRKSEDLDTSLAFGTGTTSETIAGRAER